MKLAGFLLMMSGWILVAAVLVLLPGLAGRTVFVLAGCGVELLGLVIAARAHLTLKADPHAH